MKQLMIPMHSVVDVITNSSTVIYTQAASGAVAIAKEIINDILETAGSEKTADDLFDIEVAPMFTEWDYIDDVSDSDFGDIPRPPSPKDFEGDDRYAKSREAFDKWRTDHATALKELAGKLGSTQGDCWGDDNGVRDVLTVTSKEGKGVKLAEKALDLFSQYAERDG